MILRTTTIKSLSSHMYPALQRGFINEGLDDSYIYSTLRPIVSDLDEVARSVSYWGSRE